MIYRLNTGWNFRSYFFNYFENLLSDEAQPSQELVDEVGYQ